MTSFVQLDSAPKSAEHALKWFNTVEAPKGVGKERDGTISVWFHGMLLSYYSSLLLNLKVFLLGLIGKIGRDAASKLLEKEVFGSYLVRLSAKLWGYTVSVKSKLLLLSTN